MLSEIQRRGYWCHRCETLEPAGSKFSLCSVCRSTRYCTEACQIAHWPSHKVFIYSTLIFKAECAKWKADRDSSKNPSLRRKNDKWSNNNFIHISSLVKSVMHPINRLRLESHVAMIRLKELLSGFRVLSADAVSIESLPESHKQFIREVLLSNQTNDPEEVWCIAMFEVESIDSASCFSMFEGYGLGDYSNLADIHEAAANENGCQVDLIKMLNKEI
jgi:hypothetical protein